MGRDEVWRSDAAVLWFVLGSVALVGMSVMAVISFVHCQLVFGGLLVAAVGFSFWYGGWRQAFELRAVGDELVWRAPFTTGSAPNSMIESWRTSVMRWDTTVVYLIDGSTLPVWKGSGLDQFLTTHITHRDEAG